MTSATSTVLQHLYKAQPQQKRKIDRFYEQYPQAQRDMELFLKAYAPFFQKNGIELHEIASFYVFLCQQMVHARLQFIRTGQYPVPDQNTADRNVYSQKDVMIKYILGLALSQYIWKHHYLVLDFFKKNIGQNYPLERVLEVGAGHGVFLWYLLTQRTDLHCVDVVDISPTAINIITGLVESLGLEKRVRVVLSDIQHFVTPHAYDFITVGEIVEHLDNPLNALNQLRQLLRPKGRLFVSTCINCPAIDHVYHFHTADQIRELWAQAGLHIESEIEIPSEDLPMDQIVSRKLDIAYAAILRREP